MRTFVAAVAAVMLLVTVTAPAQAWVAPAPSNTPLDHDSPEVTSAVSSAAARAGVAPIRITVSRAYMADLPAATLGCFPLRPGTAAPAVQMPAPVVIVQVSGTLFTREGTVRNWRMEFRGGRLCREKKDVERHIPAPDPVPSPPPFVREHRVLPRPPLLPGPPPLPPFTMNVERARELLARLRATDPALVLPAG